MKPRDLKYSFLMMAKMLMEIYGGTATVQETGETFTLEELNQYIKNQYE